MALEYKDVIKSVSYDQNEIMFNILKLYNSGDCFELDPTYSKGGFYGKSKEFPINPPRLKFDVFPIVDGVEKIEPLGKWPLEDNSIQSINIDLPFVCSTDVKEGTSEDSYKIIRRFSGYYPIERLFISYKHFLEESWRVLKPGGLLVWKCQRTISGGVNYMSPEMSFMFAHDIGFYCKDRFTLIAKQRLISGKVKKQQHSRSFDSQFYVFIKPDGTSKTRKVDYYGRIEKFLSKEKNQDYKHYICKNY